MNELIRIEEKDGKQTVSARELHEFLEVKSQFRDWIANRIEKYGFIEGTDFVKVAKILAGQNANEYHISIDMAKELSMVENNGKGQEARRYFIECERKLKTPKTLKERAAELIQALSCRVEELEVKVEEDRPKVEMFERAMKAEGSHLIRDAAKIIGVKDFGEKHLFAFLREKHVLLKDNTPYQEYKNSGFFDVRETLFEDGKGKQRIRTTTRVTHAGLSFIITLMKRAGIIEDGQLFKHGA